MSNRLLTPKIIKQFLDSYVVAQDEAKKALSYALFMHEAKELAAYKTGREQAYKSSAIMLIGSTGVGKTYLIETLAKCAGRDVHTINAKDLSSEGYVGLSFSDAFRGFVKQSGKNGAQKVESSIVFIDEFDKLCTADTRNGFNIPLQQQMLKIIEGQTLTVSNRNDEVIDTSRILFILGGNFQHMRDARKDKSASMGFAATNQTKQKALHDELADNGMIRELAGRISLVAELHELSLEHMKQIVKAKDNVVSQAIEVLDALGVDHKLTRYRIDKIIKQCIENKTGARGLQTELDKYLAETVADIDLDITEEDFLKGEEVKLLENGGNDTEMKILPYDFKHEDSDLSISFTFFQPSFKVGQTWRTESGLKVKIIEINNKYMKVETLEKHSVIMSYELDGSYPDVPELSLYCQIKM